MGVGVPAHISNMLPIFRLLHQKEPEDSLRDRSGWDWLLEIWKMLVNSNATVG